MKICVVAWTAAVVGLFAFTHGTGRVQPGETEKDGRIDLIKSEESQSAASGDVRQDSLHIEESESVPTFGPDPDGGGVALDLLNDLLVRKLPDGKALAFVNTTNTRVDGRGRLLCPDERSLSGDLPAVTCQRVMIDPRRFRVITEDVLEALAFLDVAREAYLPLYYRISQIDIDGSLGPVLYMEGSALPVVIGRGHCKRKVAYLATVLRYMDGRDDLGQIGYLDLRLDGQVVAKLKKEG